MSPIIILIARIRARAPSGATKPPLAEIERTDRVAIAHSAIHQHQHVRPGRLTIYKQRFAEINITS